IEGIVEIYSELTGDKCSVTVKKVITDDKNIVCLDTEFRDRTGDEKRKHRDNEPQRLDGNNEMQDIIWRRRTHFVHDNLKRAVRRGTYHTTRHDFRKFYNATIVVPIPPVEGGTYARLLCVDNFKGGFNIPLSLAIANYMANRLSSMLY